MSPRRDMLSQLTSPNGSENALRGFTRGVRDFLRAPMRVPPSQIKAPAKKASPGAPQVVARLSVFFAVTVAGLTTPTSISIDFEERQSDIVAYFAIDEVMDHHFQPVADSIHQALTATGNVNTLSKDLASFDIDGNEGVGFLAVLLPVATEELDLTIRGAQLQYAENAGARALFAANGIQIVMGQQTSPFDSGGSADPVSDGLTVDFTWNTRTRAALIACELEMDSLNGLTDFPIGGGGIDIYDWSSSAQVAKQLVLSGTPPNGGYMLMCVVVVNRSDSAGEPTVTDSDDNTWYKAATVKF